MRKILVTGGTVFVSMYIAEKYVSQGEEVYVLNRNTKQQSEGVHLIAADRNRLKDELRHYYFDVVIDTAYTADEIRHLCMLLVTMVIIFLSVPVQFIQNMHRCRFVRNHRWQKTDTGKIWD